MSVVVGVLIGAAGMHSLHAQPQSIKRTPLIKTDLTGVEGKEVYVTLFEAQPGAEIASHIHYGDEVGYLIEGSIDGFLEQTQTSIKSGEAFHNPREKVHGGKVTSSTPAKLLAVHIVDKDKPLTEFVPKK